MISLWITVGLIIAASCVSTLGAFFSIVGLGALFSGATISVWLMAGSLEFAKFVLAAYLHQTWKILNPVFKTYMTTSVIILSMITSLGIFGYLSDAYQSASTVLEAENIKLENIKKQQEAYESEIDRLNYSVEEIPDGRITKKLKARELIEPKILDLKNKIQINEKLITQAHLQILEVKKKVGPLIFISKNFNVDIDVVVRYLIIIFVTVFDPLAICLVIASTYSIESRKNQNSNSIEEKIDLSHESSQSAKFKANTNVEENTSQKSIQDNLVPVDDSVVLQMNFKDPESEKTTFKNVG
jgi:hypothetical protein